MNFISKAKTFILLLTASLSFQVDASSVLSVRDTITDPYAIYPEPYHADYHQLRKEWYFDNYVALSKDTDFNSSAAVLATDDEIIERLQSIETDMELPFNASVKYFINKYCSDWRGTVENMLGMSLYYMPIFEKALIEVGAPVELKYLPIIESAMRPTVKSSAKATGLWQFMYDTAKDMGITINTLVDERCDPEVSSKAAAGYLKSLYDIYHDWCLALAAYNWGPGNVNKAIARYGDSKKPDYWAIRQYMPDETKNYIPKFIAVVYVMNYYHLHNISPVLAKEPIIVDSVHVSHRVHFNQISEVLDIPVDVIRTLNPQYIKDIIPGDGQHHYTLKLPSYQIMCYVMSEDSIISHNSHLYARRDVINDNSSSKVSNDGKWIVTTEVVYYKIKRGDTPAKIAKNLGVTQKAVTTANGSKKLIAGKTIRIQREKRVPAPEPEQPEVANETLVEQDVLIEGFDNESNFDIDDNEIEIESDNEHEELILPDELNSFNMNESDDLEAEKAQKEKEEQERQAKIKAEQEKKEKEQAAKKTATQPVYHTVKNGETLGKIANKYKTTVKKIQQLNGLKNTKIRAGQRLRVK